MESRITQKGIGQNIRKLRKQKDLSQEDISRILNIPRSSVAQIELGNRHISVIELLKLSNYLDFSLDKFLSIEYETANNALIVTEPEVAIKKERISSPELNIKKIETVILYLLERCGGKPNVGEGMLSRLLYFCDYNYYEIYEEHLTGARYRKLPGGPAPESIDLILKQMNDHGLLQRFKTEYHGVPQIRHIPLVKADLTRLSAAAKEVVDRVADQFSDWSWVTINEYVQKDMPLKASETGEFIDYELAFYRETPFSARIYDEELAAQ